MDSTPSLHLYLLSQLFYFALSALSHPPPIPTLQVETAVEKVLDAAASDDPARWSLMFNKKGVAGYSQITSSSSAAAAAICVKGRCVPVPPLRYTYTACLSAFLPTCLSACLGCCTYLAAARMV